MKRKKIYVGGGAGYIGSELVPYLIEKGHSVTVADLLWFGNNLPKAVRIIKKDLFDVTHKELVGYDSFIFLAGVSNDPMAHYSPKKNFIYNAALPAYLAHEAKKAGIRQFIYGSSCSVYGNTTKICTEKTAPSTKEPYGISKLQGEHGVLQYADSSFSVVVLRQGTVCGWSRRMRYDLAINTMVKSALQNRVITVDNPAIWRPICDIKDLTVIYEAFIHLNKKVNGVFNIASGNYTVGDLAQKVAHIAKTQFGFPVKIKTYHKKTLRNYRVSTQKVQKTIKLMKKNNINSLITELIAKSQKLTNLQANKYYNIHVFQTLK